MFYVKNKRAKVDKCNICLETKPLSWDHVPPKGSIELTPVEMDNIFQLFTKKPEDAKLSESQNGLKYRTICKNCNERLGQKYDPSIKEFAESVGRYLNSKLKFPSAVNHKTKPVALMKGLLAHLLAAKIDLDNGKFDQNLRKIVLDDCKPIPADLFIYYWIYPYEQIVVMRDFAIADFGKNSQAGFFNVIKYFPIAYLIVNIPDYEGLPEMTKYRNLSVDDEVEIPIRLDEVKPLFYPEAPTDNQAIIFGQESINAMVAKRKKFK